MPCEMGCLLIEVSHFLFGNVKNLSYIVYNKERLTIKDTNEDQVKGTRLIGV